MWFDDDEPDGFPHVVEDAVFAITILLIAAGLAVIVRLLVTYGA